MVQVVSQDFQGPFRTDREGCGSQKRVRQAEQHATGHVLVVPLIVGQGQ